MVMRSSTTALLDTWRTGMPVEAIRGLGCPASDRLAVTASTAAARNAIFVSPDFHKRRSACARVVYNGDILIPDPAADGRVLAGALSLMLAIGWLLRRGRSLLHSLRAAAVAPVLSRQLASLVGRLELTGPAFFCADGVDARGVERRMAALARLAEALQTRHARSVAWSDGMRNRFSDLRFTDANRVPFPFARVMREMFNLSTVVTTSRGPWVCDLDERWTLDVGGSYGVNVAGLDQYKKWIEEGWQ